MTTSIENNPQKVFLDMRKWQTHSDVCPWGQGSSPYLHWLRAQVSLRCWGRADKAGTDEGCRGQPAGDNLPWCQRAASWVPVLEMLWPPHGAHVLLGMEAIGQPAVFLPLQVWAQLVSPGSQLPVVIQNWLHRVNARGAVGHFDSWVLLSWHDWRPQGGVCGLW